MKISTLIARLEEAKAEFGDRDVVVGEANSVRRSRMDVNVDARGRFDSENEGDKICIVQGYARLS